jgi:paraquat-inducible protein B
MSEKGRNIAIGAFVVGAGVILLALVLFVSSGGFRGKTERAIAVFEGSVKGLKVGAPLAFKGVQIGTVTKIDLVMNTETLEVMMPVELQFSVEAFDKIGDDNVQTQDPLPHLIEKGMRAQLQQQSLLTGLLYVQLDFYPNTEVRIVDIDSDLQQFPAIATDLEKLSRNLQEVDFGALLDDIRGSLTGLDKFLNDPKFQSLSGNLDETLTEIKGLASNLNTQLDETAPALNSLLANSDATVIELKADLPQLTANLEQTLTEASRALQRLETTMASVDYTLSDDSAIMYDISQAARELTATARAVKSLAETLEEQPESIIKGKSPLEN